MLYYKVTPDKIGVCQIRVCEKNGLSFKSLKGYNFHSVY